MPNTDRYTNIDDGLTIPEPMPEELMQEPVAEDANPAGASRFIPELVVSRLIDGTPKHEDMASTSGGGDDTEARCIALMGAHGGVGTTSLAIQMAYEIALSYHKNNSVLTRGNAVDPKVCLIDLNFEIGACATYLDMPPSLDMGDLSGNPDRIDPSLTKALIATHESGLALLSAPNILGGNDHVNSDTILALLDAAAQLYDVVIMDLPRLWRPWTQAAIAAADHFCVVAELTIPSLHMARDRMSAIEAALPLSQPCDVVLNQVERRSFRNALRVADASKALHRDVSGVICVDGDTVREAINCGEPVGAVRAEARYVKDVRTLLARWSLVDDRKSEKTSRHGLLNKCRKRA